MVMGRRPDVPTAGAAISAIALVGLGEQLANSLARLPFRRPWQGDSSLAHNLAQATTRQIMRSFMGYSSSLPIEEFRSVEIVLDEIAGLVLPPIVHRMDVDTDQGELGGVPGLWYRPRGAAAVATIAYFHGGGYVGTSPAMYGAFLGAVARATSCDVFAADYRLAPEFPYPAGVDDAVAVYEALLASGVPPSRLFLAGDSGGGGLVHSLLVDGRARHLPRPAGALLISPEVDLRLDEPSITQNADKDILPWNIPTAAYLHGVDPGDERVSAMDADLSDYPPVLVAFGDDEMFRDAIRRFVSDLQRGGVDTVSIEEAGKFHVFPFLMPWADGSRRVYRSMGSFVAGHVPHQTGG
jgi:epsilon-lactone hydrolase